MDQRPYVPRLADELIQDLFGQLPALLIVGPRAAGKTTTAARYARTIVRLDREAETAAFRADPDATLRGLEEPVLLDGWQMAPGVLGAVKRAVDDDPHPGRFLVTGSVHADLESPTWPGTGRLVRVPLLGMTARELFGGPPAPSWIDRIVREGAAALRSPAPSPDLRDYLELALRSGFPEPALHLSAQTRRIWLDSYVEQLLTRDADQADGGRDPARLRRYVEALALNTAGVVTDLTLQEAARINRKTAVAYEQLLRNLFVVDWLPAWSSNRLKRLTRAPKRHLFDPGLATALIGLDVDGILRQGDLLGRVLETFVTAQIRVEALVSRARPRLYHLRQEQSRHEIDLVVELGMDRVIAIEVKAEAGPGPTSIRHLRWLRDQLGDRLLLGIVLHTGPRLYELSDRIVAAPIATLWALQARP